MTMMKIRRLCYLLLLLSVASAHAEPMPLDVCIDYHCEKRKIIALSEPQWQQIFEPFEKPATNAQQERTQISASIALFEQMAGQRAGTDKDEAENDGSDEIGQLDCISESTNSTLYLKILEKEGKLRWHTVNERKRRSTSLFSVHWSAVIKDKITGTRYVVDSWFYKNGAAPVIQKMEQWLDKKPASNSLIP